MDISDISRLEPKTWWRFLLFLLVIVSILLLLSFLAPRPHSRPMAVDHASD
jgi:hypothetical protein